jgi:hypothetical protein
VVRALLYAISRWKVSKANAKKHLEMISEVSEWVKQNRKKCHFRHSIYCLLKTEGPSTETWMNIDEYKDPESYEKFAKIFQKSNPDYGGLFRIEEEVASLLVPNSLTREVYVEKPELRII